MFLPLLVAPISYFPASSKLGSRGGGRIDDDTVPDRPTAGRVLRPSVRAGKKLPAHIPFLNTGPRPCRTRVARSYLAAPLYYPGFL